MNTLHNNIWNIAVSFISLLPFGSLQVEQVQIRKQEMDKW
jgi:hypothetical protein